MMLGPHDTMTMITTTPPALAPLRAVVADLQAERPEWAGRLPAALMLLATHDFAPCAYTTGWWVGPAADGHTDLVVRLAGYDVCSCSGHRRRGCCPHVVAVALWERLQEAP